MVLTVVFISIIFIQNMNESHRENKKANRERRIKKKAELAKKKLAESKPKEQDTFFGIK
jgi:F0F1-type ATP synthase epsilon subunit